MHTQVFNFKKSLLSSLHVQTLLAFSRFPSGLSQMYARRCGECSSRLPPRATERAAQGEPGPEPAGAPSPVQRKSRFAVRRAEHSAPPTRRACIEGGTAALRALTAGSQPPRAPSHPELRRPPGRTSGTGGKRGRYLVLRTKSDVRATRMRRGQAHLDSILRSCPEDALENAVEDVISALARAAGNLIHTGGWCTAMVHGC